MFRDFDFFKIFDLKRIFAATPGSFNFYTEFLVFFSAIFLLFVIAFLYRQFFAKDKVTKKLLKRVRKFLFSLSFWGFLYIFLRWQNVSIFSSRAVLYIIAIVYAVRLFFLLRYYFYFYKKELSEYIKKQEIKKYIPKKKKKK